MTKSNVWSNRSLRGTGLAIVAAALGQGLYRYLRGRGMSQNNEEQKFIPSIMGRRGGRRKSAPQGRRAQH